MLCCRIFRRVSKLIRSSLHPGVRAEPAAGGHRLGKLPPDHQALQEEKEAHHLRSARQDETRRDETRTDETRRDETIRGARSSSGVMRIVACMVTTSGGQLQQGRGLQVAGASSRSPSEVEITLPTVCHQSHSMHPIYTPSSIGGSFMLLRSLLELTGGSCDTSLKLTGGSCDTSLDTKVIYQLLVSIF